MKTLLLSLYILFGLWVVALGDENKHISPTPVGEFDGVVLFAFPGHKLPLALLGGAVDHADIEVVSLSPVAEPHAQVGMLHGVGNDAHLAINTPRDGSRNIGSVIRDDGYGLVLEMEHRSVLSEAGHGHREEGDYKEQPFHAANIAII